ncbi:MAG: hypothetical protein M3P98_04235 [bacterium]|nr:hypothetical protein [bacterium]
MSRNVEKTLASIYLLGPIRNSEEEADMHLGAARKYGRAWNWDAAERALDRAYQVLGGQNPGTGYDWHAGIHPLQRAIAQEREEIMDL